MNALGLAFCAFRITFCDRQGNALAFYLAAHPVWP